MSAWEKVQEYTEAHDEFEWAATMFLPRTDDWKNAHAKLEEAKGKTKAAIERLERIEAAARELVRFLDEVPSDWMDDFERFRELHRKQTHLLASLKIALEKQP